MNLEKKKQEGSNMGSFGRRMGKGKLCSYTTFSKLKEQK